MINLKKKHLFKKVKFEKKDENNVKIQNVRIYEQFLKDIHGLIIIKKILENLYSGSGFLKNHKYYFCHCVRKMEELVPPLLFDNKKVLQVSLSS